MRNYPDEAIIQADGLLHAPAPTVRICHALRPYRRALP